jgi:hypothetical protein
METITSTNANAISVAYSYDSLNQKKHSLAVVYPAEVEFSP